MAVPKPLKRVADFENLGFGMFAHWGLYSQLGVGEWTFNQHKRDMNEYKKLADTFTAEDFNAEGYPYGKSTCVRVAKAKIKK